MQNLCNQKILIGICGGIAVYKTAFLIRELVQMGAEVKVIMTQSAQQFISPLTCQALSRNEVRYDLFDCQSEHAMGHIELARWADILLIAPASGNFLAKMAHGLADDLLSTIYLATETPVIVCPAMNRAMWSHEATVSNCDILRKRGVLFVGPEEGVQACQEEGLGRMSEVSSIITALKTYKIKSLLTGKKILITAGPTREAIDPIRFISNHSSGKMGYALACAAHMAGAEVTLVTGPTSIKPPFGVKTQQVESAQEMLSSVLNHLEEDIIFISTAAVADYGVDFVAPQKIKKRKQKELTLKLHLNPDILSEVVQTKKCAFVVGFAAETEELLKHAQEKLMTKKVNMIIANQVGKGLGFDSDFNQVIVLTENQQIALPLASKIDVAAEIIAILSANLQNQPTSLREIK